MFQISETRNKRQVVTDEMENKETDLEFNSILFDLETHVKPRQEDGHLLIKV